MRVRRFLLATAATVLFAATVAPAAQAGDNRFLVRVAPSKGGEYTQELQNQAVAVGETENFFFRIRSYRNPTTRIVFDDFAVDPNPAGYKIRWFTDDGENITSEVQAGDHRFRLPNHATEFIEMRAKQVEAGGACVGGGGVDRDAMFAASAVVALNTFCT